MSHQRQVLTDALHHSNLLTAEQKGTLALVDGDRESRLSYGFSFGMFLERGLSHIEKLSDRLRKLQVKPLIYFPRDGDFLILPKDCYPELRSNQEGPLTTFLDLQGYILLGDEGVKCDEEYYTLDLTQQILGKVSFTPMKVKEPPHQQAHHVLVKTSSLHESLVGIKNFLIVTRDLRISRHDIDLGSDYVSILNSNPYLRIEFKNPNASVTIKTVVPLQDFSFELNSTRRLKLIGDISPSIYPLYYPEEEGVGPEFYINPYKNLQAKPILLKFWDNHVLFKTKVDLSELSTAYIIRYISHTIYINDMLDGIYEKLRDVIKTNMTLNLSHDELESLKVINIFRDDDIDPFTMTDVSRKIRSLSETLRKLADKIDSVSIPPLPSAEERVLSFAESLILPEGTNFQSYV
jgi:hypothetical protein